MLCSQCQFDADSFTTCKCGQTLCADCLRLHACTVEDRPLWPHQVRAIEMIDGAIAEGCKAMCVVAPTGSGKSRTVAEFIKRETVKGKTFL